VAQTPQVVFVWKDRFPNGYPTSPEEFMAQAEKLKADGHYAITFMGSTDYDGLALTRFVWTAISSFGGKLDDGNGKMTLNTPENIAAIQFMRDLVAKQYAPEVAFAGKFQEESAFKDASAGSFPTGMFGYRYVNPLTAPDGTKYEKGNEQDMIDAINAGDVYLSPFFGANGHKPGCGTAESAVSIPTGAKNVDAAHDYINWIMSPEQNADWVLTLGAGFPTLRATESQPQFQTEFYKEAAKVVEASVCTPWYGSLTRLSEAQTLVMNTVYKLIKEDPTADIASTLTAAEEEYNKGN
jgi:multiple sugar transport system substrate-binding protein